MGCVRKLKCSRCGNVWTHIEGVGFKGKPQKGSQRNNTTGDADGIIRCPKCGSEDFEQFGDDSIYGKGVILLWD